MSSFTGNDELLMLTILKLKDNAYGVTIMKHLAEITGREWTIGAIYDPLYKLEKNGLVSSQLSAPTRERGGRSKRVYRVTRHGIEALREQQRIRDELTGGIADLIIPE